MGAGAYSRLCRDRGLLSYSQPDPRGHRGAVCVTLRTVAMQRLDRPAVPAPPPGRGGARDDRAWMRQILCTLGV
jgi:hypothetical protein